MALPAESHEDFNVRYVGKGSELFFLLLKNLVLTVITFGIYHFWAKTSLRRYHWAHITIGQHRLHYTGFGRELFIGFLKAGSIYLALSALTFAIRLVDFWPLTIAWIALGGLAFSCLYPLAYFFALRYRLSRSHYRNIRFGLTGTLRPLLSESLKDFLLTVITLGIYFPIYQNNLHRRLVNMSHYGSLKMSYNGANGRAWWIHFKLVVFGILTLGLYVPFYVAEFTRFKINHTRVGELQLSSQVQGTQILWLSIVSFIAVPLSFGLATPWLLAFRHRVMINSLSISGAIDFAQIQQTTRPPGAMGEELTEIFNIDVSF